MSDRLEVTPSEPRTDDEKLGDFMISIAKDADVVTDQRDKANEDMRFVNVSGGMWEGFFEDQQVISRVKLELDLVSDFLNTFLGEWDLNRVGVEFKADDDKTSDDDAELLNGIYRADFRKFSGKIATDHMVDEVATCGYGALKLATVFEDEADPENDNQRIEWRPIYNAYNSVFWDQAAQRIDKRDARHCTVLKQFTRDSFKDVYTDFDAVSAYVPESRAFENLNVETSDIIYIATRYEVVRKMETVFVYNNLATGKVESYNKEDHEFIKDELASDDLRVFVRERKVFKQSIEKTVFSGEDILDPTRRIAGKWIPIIPCYGYRSYVDGVEWYHGLVRKLKDAARLFNMQISQLAENAASDGQEKPIFDPQQMEGPDISALWSDMNNKPYLLARSLRDDAGKILQTGPIGYTKPGNIGQSAATLLSVVPDYIQSITGGAPQETLNPDMSGKAIKALIQRENMKTQTVRDNIANSISWSGEVYQSMASEIYNTPRIIDTIGLDGTEGEKQLFKLVLDEETGKVFESNTLDGKKFRAYSDSGPQYETLREQTVEDLKGMLEALRDTPGGDQYTPAVLSILMENIVGVGLAPLKKLNRRIMLTQGLVKPDNDEEEAVLQQIQQQAQEPDPNQKLIEAASEQQISEARNLDASSVLKIADSRKREAETVKIISETQINQDRLFLDIQKQVAEERKAVRESLEGLPI